MSDSFTVDVVATPHLDLCGATARDMQYREANGKYPAASRSAVAKEQEKLNKFLQYVNESFIIKGFSKASVQARSPVRGYTSGNTAPALVKETPEVLCDFDLSHGENAQILVLFSITGNGGEQSRVRRRCSPVSSRRTARPQRRLRRSWTARARFPRRSCSSTGKRV